MPQKPSNQSSTLVYLKITTWPKVYQRWAADERKQADWSKHYRSLGYASWQAWREAVVIKPFRLGQRRWKLYRVTDLAVVLDWHGGPFPRWIREYYRGAQTRSFRWLVESGHVARKAKVRAIRKVPSTVTIFGLRVKNKIYVLDGMHRCAAIAVHASHGQAMKTRITIALADAKTLPRLKSRLI